MDVGGCQIEVEGGCWCGGCILICMHVYICVYICINMYICIYVHIYMYVYIFVCIYICICSPCLSQAILTVTASESVVLRQ